MTTRTGDLDPRDERGGAGGRGWAARLRLALAELEPRFDQHAGYPMDVAAHVVTDPDPGSAENVRTLAVAGPLRDLYAEVGEVALPDVHVGYFVHPAAYLTQTVERGLPTRVETGPLTADVTAFGSDGGGGLFALADRDGSVWHLPPGAVHDGVYSAGLDEPHRVAADLPAFLDLLLAAVRELAATGRVTVL